MARRGFDVLAAIVGLLCCAPLIAAAAVIVRLSSPGPVFYRARRVGRNGRPFTMFKLRTMHVRPQAGCSITAADDQRIFPAGRLLRATKVDELPQLWNVLRGDMAIVGPRPEAPDIVSRWYSADHLRTLNVRPGLTSPGSLHYYQTGEQQLAEGDAEEFYGRVLLPEKMTRDLAWLEQSSLLTDAMIVARTAGVLLQKVLRRRAASDAGPSAPRCSSPADDPSARRAA